MNDKYLLHDRLLEILDDILDKRSHGIVAGNPEKTDAIKFKHTLYGLIPTFLYEIFYISNVLLNMKDGKVSPSHDWYYFTQNGLLIVISIPFVMLGITYIVSLITWRLNKKR